jgi:hypothetical protein
VCSRQFRKPKETPKFPLEGNREVMVADHKTNNIFPVVVTEEREFLQLFRRSLLFPAIIFKFCTPGLIVSGVVRAWNRFGVNFIFQKINLDMTFRVPRHLPPRFREHRELLFSTRFKVKSLVLKILQHFCR